MSSRWKVLLRRAKDELELLSRRDLEELVKVEPDSEDQDPSKLLEDVQLMVSDLQELLMEAKAANTVQSPALVTGHKGRGVSDVVVSGRGKREGSASFEVPGSGPYWKREPVLLTLLTDYKSQLCTIDEKLANLGPRTPGKVHRALLEDKSTLQSRLDRVIHKIEEYRSLDTLDFLSIGSTESLFILIRHVDMTTPDSIGFRAFLVRFLVHSVLLTLIERSLSLIQPKDNKTSLVVDKILDLRLMVQSMDQGLIRGDGRSTGKGPVEQWNLQDIISRVWRHPALDRLAISELLDKKTRKRFLKTSSSPDVRESDLTVIKSGKVSEAIEFWIMTRPDISDAEMMIDSCAIKPELPTLEEASVAASAPRSLETVSDQIESIHGVPEPTSYFPQVTREEGPAGRGTALDGCDELELPSAPSTELRPTQENRGFDEGHTDSDPDESEVQRLLQLFAPSKKSSTSSASCSSQAATSDEGGGESDLEKLSPSEREEVLKALAAAEKNYEESLRKDLIMKDTESHSISDLLDQAKDALRIYGASSSDGEKSKAAPSEDLISSLINHEEDAAK